MGGKVCLRCKGKTLLGVVNKLFVFKSLLTTPSNVLPLHLKQTFLPKIWISNEGKGDRIESRLPFKIFCTLSMKFQNLNMPPPWDCSNRHYFIRLHTVLSEREWHGLMLAIETNMKNLEFPNFSKQNFKIFQNKISKYFNLLIYLHNRVFHISWLENC